MPGWPSGWGPARRGRRATEESTGTVGRRRPAIRSRLELAHLVGPEREGPAGGDRGVLLPQRAGGRVPRVDEQPLAGLGLAPVELLEGGDGHVDLAPHLDHLRWRADGPVEPIGDVGDGGHVGGDVLAGAPVPSGGGLDEPAVAVGEGDGQSVDLELADEGGVRRGPAWPAGRPRPASSSGLKALSRLIMGTRWTTGANRAEGAAPTVVVGESGHHQVGMVGLDGPQLAHQGVVLGVGDLGVVEPVVAVVVVGDQGPQLLGPGHRVESARPRWSDRPRPAAHPGDSRADDLVAARSGS